MAGVENKQPPLGGHLIVKCKNQTYQPDPKGNLLYQVTLQSRACLFLVDEVFPPGEQRPDRNSPCDYTDRPVIDQRYFIVALVSTELGYARICYS